MKPPSQATQIVELSEGYNYFVSPDGQAFVQFVAADHLETWPVRSDRFRRHLAHLFYSATKTAPGSDGVRSALAVLEDVAHRGPVEPVYTRIGYHEARETVYLDLCNADWEAVAINAITWEVVSSEAVPIHFRRGRAMLALPEPSREGDVTSLKKVINVSDSDFILVIGFLVGAFRPTGPYPNLELHGEQDAGKSKATLFIRDLVDPHKLKLRAQPKDIRDFSVAVENTWLVAFDNLSHIPVWFSDALCRLSTGGGISFRKLYTDDEERIFEGQRPVVMNGINELAVRGDLFDRSVQVTLKPIDESKRLSERELFEKFYAARPRILGGLLDAVSAAIANESKTTIKEKPRMMDWAVWVTAAESELPIKPGDFLRTYIANRKDATAVVLDYDTVGAELVEWMKTRTTWKGTATDLLRSLEAGIRSATDGADRLERLQRDKDSGWPKDGTRMGRALRRLAPVLRRSGYEVKEPEREARPRSWIITPPEVGKTASAASAGAESDATDTTDAEIPTAEADVRPNGGDQHAAGGGSQRDHDLGGSGAGREDHDLEDDAAGYGGIDDLDGDW